MKVGDLVRFRIRSADLPPVPLSHFSPPDTLGLIMKVARATLSSPSRYQIWWTAQNKTGWWDAHKLEQVE